ncbi:Rhodanese-like domain protein [Phycisphaerae bacterium RAS1]|nr:Rhodanese-like domain protein [Phycisphaerae bacterium RAS1]
MIAFAMRTILILAASAAAGIGYAHWVKGLPLVPDPKDIGPPPQPRSEYEKITDRASISLEDFKAHFMSGGLVIDARPAEEFLKGHLDAPLILNVPADGVAQHIVRLDAFRGLPIVLYCTSTSCHMAHDVLIALEQAGYFDLKIYIPGWDDGIVKFGLPIASGPEPMGAAPDSGGSGR